MDDSERGVARRAPARARSPCASGSTRRPITGRFTASPTDCPGLVIDRYGQRCVVQIGTAGMESMKPLIREAAERALQCETLIFKNDGAARELEGLPAYVEAAKGRLEDAATVIEGGLKFQVPLAEGQKTGWFFDQAANRRALSKYVRKGSRVLDVFSYVGAWGVRAAKDGAAEVVCVDSSRACARARDRKRAAERTRDRARSRAMHSTCSRRLRASAGGSMSWWWTRPPSRSARRICRRRSPRTSGSNQLALAVVADGWDPRVVLVLLSREPRGARGGDRQGSAGRGQALAAPRARRSGTGSPGASGHSRNTLSQDLFLPRQ